MPREVVDSQLFIEHRLVPDPAADAEDKRVQEKDKVSLLMELTICWKETYLFTFYLKFQVLRSTIR